MDNKTNTADVYKPIIASTPGQAPLYVKIAVKNKPQMMAAGAQSSVTKIEMYVLFSALPEDLRNRVATAIQMLSTGI